MTNLVKSIIQKYLHLTKENARKEHSKLVASAKTAFTNENFDLALSLTACAANQAYHLNYCYTDAEIEGLLVDISRKVLGQVEKEPKENNWVFYDDFGYDNRGLTQQYLHALNCSGANYLYILDSKEFSEGGSIANQVNENPNAKIILVPQDLDGISKLRYIFNIITEFNPGKAFLHLAPWSSMAVALWNAFPKVERYFIDLTDHAFWLGTSCSNYFIGFRDYGYNISIRERLIDRRKLLHLPYYPVVSSSKFLGFPSEATGRVVVFSGGNYYKIYGENDTFFTLIRRVVNENPQVVILFAGSGDVKPFQKFISDNDLEENVFLIGNRSDINDVFANCDIYLNTYPIIGGLMSQYAVMNNKPLIGYTSDDIPCNESEGLFKKQPHYTTTYYDLEQFHTAINHLISSKLAREEASDYPNGILPNPESFYADFLKVINDRFPASFREFGIDVDRFSDVYVSMENNYLRKFNAIKFRHLGYMSFVCMPLRSAISLFHVVIYNFSYITKYIKGGK